MVRGGCERGGGLRAIMRWLGGRFQTAPTGWSATGLAFLQIDPDIDIDFPGPALAFLAVGRACGRPSFGREFPCRALGGRIRDDFVAESLRIISSK